MIDNVRALLAHNEMLLARLKKEESELEAIGAGGVSAAPITKTQSDGSAANYYELPAGATVLQHLISHRDMNAQIGEIFRSCYRYGLVSHSPKIRDIKKILFYAQAELARLEQLK